MTGLSINKHIYSILKDDAQLLEMCQNIYPVIAEETVKFPFILFTRSNIQVMDSKCHIAGDNVGFAIAIVNDKYMLTVDIAERIRELFEKRRDGYFSDCSLTGCDEEYSNDAYVQRLYFTATIMRNNN